MARHSPWSDVKEPDFFSHPLATVRSNESPGIPSTASPGWNINTTAKGWNNSSPSINRRNMSSEITPQKNGSAEKDLWSRYEQLKSIEGYKNALIEETIVRCEYLEQELRSLSEAYEHDRAQATTFQRSEKTYQDTIRRLRSLMDREPFVFIIIDGNNMTFSDQLLQSAESGGAQAARMLYNNVRTYISRNLPDIPSDSKIVARVYVDFESAGEAYWNAGVIDHPSKFNEFARGLMCEEALFDFVDVGRSRDFANRKIIESFKLHLYDYHCRQIFFGCSGEEIFASILDKVANDEQCTKRVTLLEGLPFGKDFETLPFERTKFSSMFRASKLEINSTNRDSSASPSLSLDGQRLPPPPTQAMEQMDLRHLKEFTPQVPIARAASVSTDSGAKPSPITSWASAVKSAVPVTPPSAMSTPSKAATPGVPRNRKGQRVDPLIKHDKDEVDRVKKKKWCNVHFLRNECPYGDNCTHIHDAKPTAAELQTLRLVARMAPCMNGSDCPDAKCIYGHICPAPEGRDGKDCIFGENCRFPSYLHKIDRAVVKTVKV